MKTQQDWLSELNDASPAELLNLLLAIVSWSRRYWFFAGMVSGIAGKVRGRKK